jgi:hypothetical protein
MTKPDQSSTFATRLDALMRAHNENAVALADKLDVNEGSVRNWLKGRITPPRQGKSISKLVTHYGVTANDLLGPGDPADENQQPAARITDAVAASTPDLVDQLNRMEAKLDWLTAWAGAIPATRPAADADALPALRLPEPPRPRVPYPTESSRDEAPNQQAG